MPTIAHTSVLDKLPVDELSASLHTFLEPVAALLPDVRQGALLD